MLSRLWCDVHGQWVGGQLFWVSTVLHARGIRAIRATAKSKATSWAPTHEDEAQVERCKRHDSDSDWFEHILDILGRYTLFSRIFMYLWTSFAIEARASSRHPPNHLQQWKDMKRYDKKIKEVEICAFWSPRRNCSSAECLVKRSPRCMPILIWLERQDVIRHLMAYYHLLLGSALNIPTFSRCSVNVGSGTESWGVQDVKGFIDKMRFNKVWFMCIWTLPDM